MAQEKFLDPPLKGIIEQWRCYLSLLKISEADIILDIGCNQGDTELFAVDIYPYLKKIIGVDINLEAIKIAGKKLKESNKYNKIEFIEADAQSLPFADNSFDKIIALEMLEWVESPADVIKEIYRVLKDDGIALIGHSDFDTQIYSTNNLERFRKINNCFCDLGPDGIIGRKLGGMCRKLPFSNVENKVYVLTNETFRENSYSYKMALMMKNWLLKESKLDKIEINEWFEELQTLSEQNEFYYSINRYLTLCYN